MLAGCAGGASVRVETSVPSPLIEPLPVRIGVYYDSELTNYVHVEDVADHGEFSIDLGASQIPVFERVFDAMFTEVTTLRGETPDEVDASAPAFLGALGGVDVDAVLAPSIQELQFAIPDQTKGDFYEVWIKYRMELFAPDGSVIAAWDLLGYGKANSDNYGTVGLREEEALIDATTWALRDAAAFLSVHFLSYDGVRQWVEGRS